MEGTNRRDAGHGLQVGACQSACNPDRAPSAELPPTLAACRSYIGELLRLPFSPHPQVITTLFEFLQPTVHIEHHASKAHLEAPYHWRNLGLISFGAVAANMVFHTGRLGLDAEVKWLPASLAHP